MGASSRVFLHVCARACLLVYVLVPNCASVAVSVGALSGWVRFVCGRERLGDGGGLGGGGRGILCDDTHEEAADGDGTPTAETPPPAPAPATEETAPTHVVNLEAEVCG